MHNIKKGYSITYRSVYASQFSIIWCLLRIASQLPFCKQFIQNTVRTNVFELRSHPLYGNRSGWMSVSYGILQWLKCCNSSGPVNWFENRQGAALPSSKKWGFIPTFLIFNNKKSVLYFKIAWIKHKFHLPLNAAIKSGVIFVSIVMMLRVIVLPGSLSTSS